VKRIALLLLTAVPFCLTCEMKAATVNPAVEYATVSFDVDSEPYTLGYEFTTSVNFTVDALGYWDDGQVNNHQVGIWDTGGNLLVSTTVLGSDALTGHFRYHSIPTFYLAAGTYVIGGEFFGNNDPFPEDATGLTSVAGYTWITDMQLHGAGLNFPTYSTSGGYGDNGIFLADFSVNGSTAAVPEPATWSLMLSAAMLAGVGYRRKFQAGFRK
jgi:hypothetical protein